MTFSNFKMPQNKEPKEEKPNASTRIGNNAKSFTHVNGYVRHTSEIVNSVIYFTKTAWRSVKVKI